MNASDAVQKCSRKPQNTACSKANYKRAGIQAYTLNINWPNSQAAPGCSTTLLPTENREASSTLLTSLLLQESKLQIILLDIEIQKEKTNNP